MRPLGARRALPLAAQQPDRHVDLARALRTVAVVDDETVDEVTARIGAGLRDDGRWTVVTCRVVDIADGEQDLARRLAVRP